MAVARLRALGEEHSCVAIADPQSASCLPPELQSGRIVVISDFNCPYCFTLNAWLNILGVSRRVYWVGVEHKPHLPKTFSEENLLDDVQTLNREVSDVMLRAPEVGVKLPSLWCNSHQALLLQAAVEADQPELAGQLRTTIFERLWREGRCISETEELIACEHKAGVQFDTERFLDEEQLHRISNWWQEELDRIPCMFSPSGVRHLGLQDLATVEAFVLGALNELPAGPTCK